MLAVVSPAKKLDESPAIRDIPATQPVFHDQIRDLLSVTRDLSRADLRQLMSISENLAELNYQRFRDFKLPFTADNAKIAVETFRGDTYIGLDADSLDNDDLTYAQDHLRILSGFYGLLRPLDLMQPYRLEMGIRLRNPLGEDLYDFWGDQISGQLDQELERLGGNVLVNLASNEYFKAVRPKKLAAGKARARVVTPVFKEIKDGVAKVISFPAKRARGMMARYMIQQRIDRPEGLKDFSAGGYAFQPGLSDDATLLFTREQGMA
ncbi:peroxide stress protein YaaA [Kiloniella laminariae]|uniref:peroxide stress protein YaaA n=1 Tax=Kiloniella laminariae TaxID=454162 RepID=UPI00035F895C|nr:peroxide stress protein YaaA [Kiloniella laminariae]